MIFWASICAAISAFFFIGIKAPLMRAYLLVNYVLIINPVFLWAFFGIAHPRFVPGDERYQLAMMFMAAFNVVLCISFILLMRTMSQSRLAQRAVMKHRLSRSSSVRAILLIALTLWVLGFAAKWGLNSLGALRMLDEGGSGDNPFLQALKVGSAFDQMAIILLGEVRIASQTRKWRLNAVLIGMITASAFAALYTGSRAQAVIVLIIALLAYRDVARRYWFVVFPAIAAVIPLAFKLFPLLALYRGLNYDFERARYVLEKSGATVTDIMLDVLSTRLNYLETFARAVGYVQHYGPAGGSIYWNNIIGFIPRLLWPGKPEISNDSQALGHLLGLVGRDDRTTSIGLQVVGEAFYEYGWIGLWVAVFQALIFTMIHKNFYRPGNAAAMTVYIFTALYILQRDGYFAVVPGLIWLAIGFFLFFLPFALLLPKPRRVPINENLPYRIAH